MSRLIWICAVCNNLLLSPVAVKKLNHFNPAYQYKYLCKHAEPDETARNEPSHQDLHCLPFLSIFDWHSYLQEWMCPYSEMDESISETQGRKG